MKNTLGIMDLYEEDIQVRTLTTKRPIATLPFAGRYRLLDFALSSMVNSGITKVGMMMPNKSRSILDHLRSVVKIGIWLVVMMVYFICQQ